MSRASIAERARFSLFAMRRGARLLTARTQAHPLMRWRFVSTRTDRLLIAPQDLRTADPTRASEIYSGRFAFAGKVVVCSGRSPFTLLPPSPAWAEQLAGFGWLRHLRAAESSITRSNARSLVASFIADAVGDPIGWRPDVVSRRILSWITHAPFLLHDADARFYRRFMRSLAQQVRFLRGAAGALPDGQLRLQALAALNVAALCMAGEIKLLRTAGPRLATELDRQILADGGHIGRNPGALIELLLDLLPLRQAFGARNMAPPVQLSQAIDRMMPMLRFFRHGDGAFANFNGMGATPPDLVATVLAYDDARGTPVSNAALSGYQRMEANGSLVLMDTGAPPPMNVSHEAHAGCLSFEFSAGRQRIVVNCGLPRAGGEGWRDEARATKSHSTLCFAEASSCRFLEAGALQRWLGAPITGGPTHVSIEREDGADGAKVRASHDGYAGTFGILHQRIAMLSADGRRLDGEDAILPARGNTLPARASDRFAVRFHLHPSVRAIRLTHRHGVMLTLPNRDVWTFESYEHEAAIEDSVYLAGPDGPRHCLQIVVRGQARQADRVGWSFVQVNPTDGRAFDRSPLEPELPL